MLTKGPVGLLPVVIWGAYALVARRWEAVTNVRPFAGLVIVVLIAAPWYVLMFAQNGHAFTDFAIGHEIIARVMSEDSFAPARGSLYYAKTWPGDAAPWSLLFIAALAWCAVRWRELDASARHAMTFALTWFLSVFVLFSLSRSKVVHYVLPAYPAAALMIGRFLDRVAALRESRWWRIPVAIISAALLACGVGLAASIDVLLPNSGTIVRALVPSALIVGAIVTPLATWRSSLITATIGLAATLSLTFAAVGAVIVPRAVEPFKPMPRLARAAARVAQPGARIGLLGRSGASSVIYYSHHNVEWLDDDASTIAFLWRTPRAVVVMPADDFQRLRRDMPATAQIVDTAEEFFLHVRRLLEGQRTPGRKWVVVVVARDPSEDSVSS